jgi:carbonic anhydrase
MKLDFVKFMKKLFVIALIIFTASCKKEWSYEGSSSPQHWGDLDDKFKFCKIGYNQSPINIKEKFENGADLKFFYNNSDVEKERFNYVNRVNFDGKNLLLRGKKKYFLKHLEFHHPSEHLVDDKQHSLELQIAHKSDDEQWLILAVFLEVGKENAEFSKIVKLFSNKEKEGKIDLSKIIKSDDQIFFYDGSFTTPPCKEGVKWYVMKTPLTISKEQMNQIIKLGIFAKSNARMTQAFHPEKY